ncbi:MAG: AAA family ATPase [Candidatus Harrisonbacteria bacterium]|nr:AAA family ATPase [Candidatus Harrisonbacteria bacterium]
MFVGHEHLVKDFKTLVKSGKLAHGYIFFGEPEVGKFYFAKHLANLLESGELNLSARPLSDALILADSSGIDAMREIKNFLWQKPNISSKRLVVINDAENLTPQAQNAILKITEEPPEHSLIILIVNQLDNLLLPLLSRMQKIYFGRLSDEEIYKCLNIRSSDDLNIESDNFGSSDDQKIVKLSLGRPGRAVRLLSDDLMKQAEGYVNNFLRMNGKAKSDLIKELVEEQKEKPELLDKFFESLILKLRQDPVKNLDALKSVLHRLFLIKSYNVNKRLQLEAI